MILDDPQLFLHHVNFTRRVGVFVKVSQELIDERIAHDFDHIEPKHIFDLDRLLEEGCHWNYRPPHFLFMTDFCGSTLAANALAALRGVRCLYEVRAFAALAIHRRILDRNKPNTAAIEDWQRVLRLAIGIISRSGGGADTLLLKEWPPTNYIISDILRSHDDIKAIFLYSGLEDYLNAVFRQHWRRNFTRQRVVTEFAETDLWPMIDAGKHSFSDGQIAAAHWFLQQQAFLRIDEAVLPRVRSLHNSEIYDHPAATLAAMARHFGIETGQDEAERAFASVSNRHSKNREKPYSMAERNRELELAAQSHHREITGAVAQARIWLDAYPIPQRLPWSL